MAYHAGRPGVSQEERVGSRGFPPGVSAGWSSSVQAAGATQTRDGGQSKQSKNGKPHRLIFYYSEGFLRCITSKNNQVVKK